MSEATGWLLFLDFDGVLNNDAFLRRQKNHVASREHRLFDPANVVELNRLCQLLPIDQIVITSTWRRNRTVAQLRELMFGEGFEYTDLVTGVTNELGGDAHRRADEIDEFVAEHLTHDRWFVLDDLNMGPFFEVGHFFWSSPATGLTPGLTDSIISSVGGGV